MFYYNDNRVWFRVHKTCVSSKLLLKHDLHHRTDALDMQLFDSRPCCGMHFLNYTSCG